MTTHPFVALFAASGGSYTKARRMYIRERQWKAEDWYRAWENGLAQEVAACQW